MYREGDGECGTSGTPCPGVCPDPNPTCVGEFGFVDIDGDEGEKLPGLLLFIVLLLVRLSAIASCKSYSSRSSS